MRSRFSGWMVAVGIGIIIVGAVVATLLLARPATCESTPVEGDDRILKAVYQLARAFGPFQREVWRGFEDGEAQLPFTFTGKLTGTDVLVADSPVGPMVVQFTRNGVITGTDSLGNQQLVWGECAFQWLAGEDPEDTDLVYLAEVLVGACDDPAVEVGLPSACVTPTVEEPEPEPGLYWGYGITWFHDPRAGCGNPGDITVDFAGTLRIRELIGGVWQEFNIASDVWGLEKFYFDRDEEGLYYVVVEYTIGEAWQGQRLRLDEIFPSCSPELEERSFDRGWPYLDSTDPCCGNHFSVAVTGEHELRFVEIFTDTQGSWEVVEIWKDDDLSDHLFFGGLDRIERGWDSAGPWIIVHLWTWNEERGAYLAQEYKFLTAQMFGRTSIYECEPVVESDKG